MDRLKKITDGIRNEGVATLYEHLAEDAPMHWVAETESHLQVLGGTESQKEIFALRQRREMQKEIIRNGKAVVLRL